MKLTSNEKQKIYFDSFDMFKNDWKDSADTIVKSIAEVAKFDTDSAIQMWLYILKKNSQRIGIDKKITSGVVNALPESAYTAVVQNSYIKKAIFLASFEPWESIELVTYFLFRSDFYTANELFEIISQNHNISKNNYSGYTSSNISTCLYYAINLLDNFNEDDIDFLLDWIEYVDNANEKMKLKVLLLSKEAEPNGNSNSGENNYLLEGSSLEDLELASSNREKFEIKKLIECICNYTISKIDFSQLELFWLRNAFKNSYKYSEEGFNIIGAYYTINNLSWDTQRILKKIYKDRAKIESLWKDPFTGDTEFSIKQKLVLIQESINEMSYRWNFDEIHIFSNSIIKLFDIYTEYICSTNEARNQELLKYNDMPIETIITQTRIRNILVKHQIFDIPSLVRFIDSGKHIEGLGNKSIMDICNKLSKLGINIKANSITDDLNFILDYFHIIPESNQTNEVFKLVKALDIDMQAVNWEISRTKLIAYLREQKNIGEYFVEHYSKSNCLIENMLLLRKDDISVYVPGRCFFRSVSGSSLFYNY